MLKRIASISAILILCAAGIAAEEKKLPTDVAEALSKAETIELLSLSPEELEKPPKDAFHGWRVLGKTAIKNAEIRKGVIAALQKGVAEQSSASKCFEPRHGLRVSAGGKTIDLTICFHCGQIYISREGNEEVFYTSKSPEPVLDKILKDANVPLAAK